MSRFTHGYAFDPSYGHTLPSLLNVAPPVEPDDFKTFWNARYTCALSVDPLPLLTVSELTHPDFAVWDVVYRSSGGVRIGGWLLTPKQGPVSRAVVVGHGYGGRDEPDTHLPIKQAALLFPCFRGMSRSRCEGIPENPAFHVLHGIDNPERYVLGGCVEDVWLGVSLLLQLFPQVKGHLGYLGISFGGGIGAMALAWDKRIQLAALNVPTFGHQALRLSLPTIGSGDAVSRYEQAHGHVLDTLKYYDAALSSRHITIPVHLTLALFDPAVAPPGQFAIYNALRDPKWLRIVEAGHFSYPAQADEEQELLNDLQGFFEDL